MPKLEQFRPELEDIATGDPFADEGTPEWYMFNLTVQVQYESLRELISDTKECLVQEIEEYIGE